MSISSLVLTWSVNAIEAHYAYTRNKSTWVKNRIALLVLPLVTEKQKIRWAFEVLWPNRQERRKFDRSVDFVNYVVDFKVATKDSRWDYSEVSPHIVARYFCEKGDIESVRRVVMTLPPEKRCVCIEGIFEAFTQQGCFTATLEDVMKDFQCLELALDLAVSPNEVQRLYTGGNGCIRWETMLHQHRMRRVWFVQQCKERALSFGMRLQEDFPYPYRMPSIPYGPH